MLSVPCVTVNVVRKFEEAQKFLLIVLLSKNYHVREDSELSIDN
jgi:hypothetical protein